MSITRDTAQFIAIPQRTHLEEVANNFLQQLKSLPKGYQDFEVYKSLGHELYTTLFAPLLTTDSIHKIVIAGDGFLLRLPFEALVYSTQGQFPAYESLPYLASQYNISYIPSAAIWRLLHEKRSAISAAPNSLFCVTPGFTTQLKADYLISLADLDDQDTTYLSQRPLHALPGYLKGLCQDYDGHFASEGEANEKNVRQEAPGHQIIHFGTHAVKDTNHRLLSRICLAKSNEGEDTTSNDGYLETRELFNLDLTGTEMVVLQACETGDGILDQLEGLNTMARGFFFAGVRSVVAGLWQIDESASIDLMDHFYREMAQGKTNVTALAEAKRQYLQQARGIHAHPYYWAGMVFIGDEGRITLETRNTISPWPYCLGLVALLGIAWILRHQKRKSKLI